MAACLSCSHRVTLPTVSSSMGQGSWENWGSALLLLEGLALGPQLQHVTSQPLPLGLSQHLETRTPRSSPGPSLEKEPLEFVTLTDQLPGMEE